LFNQGFLSIANSAAIRKINVNALNIKHVGSLYLLIINPAITGPIILERCIAAEFSEIALSRFFLLTMSMIKVKRSGNSIAYTVPKSRDNAIMCQSFITPMMARIESAIA